MLLHCGQIANVGCAWDSQTCSSEELRKMSMKEQKVISFSSPNRASLGNMDMEESRSHIPEISGMMTNEVKKVLHEDVKKLDLTLYLR